MKYLSKQQLVFDNKQIQSFFKYSENQIKSKIKIMELLGKLDCMKKETEKNQIVKNEPVSNNEEVAKTITNLVSCCEKNIKDIKELKKDNNSLESGDLIQNSFYIPKITVLITLNNLISQVN
jgi:hypothetical protein